jgi:hypothetical protein
MKPEEDHYYRIIYGKLFEDTNLDAKEAWPVSWGYGKFSSRVALSDLGVG